MMSVISDIVNLIVTKNIHKGQGQTPVTFLGLSDES